MRARLILALMLSTLMSVTLHKDVGMAVTPISGETLSDHSLNLGIEQYRRGELRSAIQTYQRSLEQYRQQKNQPGIAGALTRLGEAYYWLQDGEKAVKASQQALDIARSIKNSSIEADALTQLGLAYYRTKQPDKALLVLQQSLALYESLSDPIGKSAALSNLGFFYGVELNQRDQAIQFLQQSLTLQQTDSFLNGIALFRIGAIQLKFNNAQRALESLQKAVAIGRSTNNPIILGYSLNKLADLYAKKQPNLALTTYQEALISFQKMGVQPLELETLLSIADLYKMQQQYDRALATYQQALTISQQLNNKTAQLKALSGIHLIYFVQKQRQNQLATLKQLLPIARESKSLVTLALLAGLYESDKMQLIEILQALRESSPQVEALALSKLIEAYRALNDYQKMIETATQLTRVGNSLYKAYGLIMLGDAYRSLAFTQADYGKAITTVQEGLTLLRQDPRYQKSSFAFEISNNIRALEVHGISVLSSIYSSLGEYETALDLANQSLKVAQDIKDSTSQARVRFTLAEIYYALGDYAKANEAAQTAMTLFPNEAQKNPILLAIVPALAAVDAYTKGDYVKTIRSAQQSLTLLEKLDAPAQRSLKILNLLMLSVGYANSKEYQKAIEAAQQGITIARSAKERLSETSFLYVLGNTYRALGQTQQAIKNYQEALRITKSANIEGGDGLSLFGLARSYRDLNLNTTAITYYKQAIESSEKVRQKNRKLSAELQESLLKGYADIDRTTTSEGYREAANLLISQGRLAEGQQVLELLKIQELKESRLTTSAIAAPIQFNSVEDKIRQQNGTLVAFGEKVAQCKEKTPSRCSALNEEQTALIDRYNRDIQSIESEITQRKIQDKGFLDPENDFGKKAGELIDAQPNSVLIYPLVLEDKVWLLMASKGDVIQRFEIKIDRAQLSQTVEEFNRLLKTPDSDINQLKQTSQKLYDWLIKPLESELKSGKIKHLVFSLDRVTRYIPMAALFDGNRYLIEDYSVATILSASLTNLNDRLPIDRRNLNVLAMGLSKATPGFEALSNVPKELDSVVRQNRSDSGIFPGRKFLDQAFTFSTLRDNLYGSQILHLATHGVFVPDQPNQSYILLGTGEKLDIAEIKTLTDLRKIQLVTLSACETGLGKTKSNGNNNGIEIAGVSNAFLEKGAKSVMASLWKVSDNGTQLLMEQFYRDLALAQPLLSKAEALRQAQLTFLKSQTNARSTPRRSADDSEKSWIVPLPDAPPRKGAGTAGYSHPYYWAPFILIGNSL